MGIIDMDSEYKLSCKTDQIIEVIEQIFYNNDSELNITNCDIIFYEILKLFNTNKIAFSVCRTRILDFIYLCLADADTNEMIDYNLFLNNLSLLKRLKEIDMTDQDITILSSDITNKLLIKNGPQKNMVFAANIS